MVGGMVVCIFISGQPSRILWMNCVWLKKCVNGTSFWLFNREISSVSRGMNSGTTKAAKVVNCGPVNGRYEKQTSCFNGIADTS